MNQIIKNYILKDVNNKILKDEYLIQSSICVYISTYKELYIQNYIYAYCFGKIIFW